MKKLVNFTKNSLFNDKITRFKILKEIIYNMLQIKSKFQVKNCKASV